MYERTMRDQFNDDGYDEMLAIAEDLRGEGIIEDLLKGAGILARDILHVGACLFLKDKHR